MPASLLFLRFLSSKKSEENPQDHTPQSSLSLCESKLKAHTELKEGNDSRHSNESAKNSSDSRTYTKYFSFDELPKAPQSIIDQVTMNDKLFPHKPRNIFEVDEDEMNSKQYSYDFSLLPHDVTVGLSRPPASEVWHQINGLPLASQIPEHPLKKSITGIFEINPVLNEINDEVLWSLCPKGQMFENAPFDGDSSFDSVKKFEKKKNEVLKEQFSTIQAQVKAAKEFESTLYSANSFVRPKATQASKESSQKHGGRKKLDRALMKKYIKYSEEWEKSKKKK